MKHSSFVTRSILTTALFAFAIPAKAVTVLDVTTNTVLFHDDFEAGTNPPSASPGSWSLVGPNVTVTNSASPGPAQGNFYVNLFRATPLTNGEGNLDGTFASPATGHVITMSLMVYLPSATDVDARAQLFLDNGDFNSARAWFRPDGHGHVEVVGPGFGVTVTSVPYLVNTWQEWDLTYKVGDATFSFCVAGVCAGGFSSTTVGDISKLELNNGAFDPTGSFFVDAVPTGQSQTPIPGALPLFASGAGLLGYLSWSRKRKTQSAA